MCWAVRSPRWVSLSLVRGRRQVLRVAGAPGWLACQVADLVDGGDHVVAMGHVLAAETVDGHPLTNHGRLFGTHAAHQEES
jgi:flavin reductase (DIM6/NTAB) family NADH-FMN oxidoreductase RutF